MQQLCYQLVCYMCSMMMLSVKNKQRIKALNYKSVCTSTITTVVSLNDVSHMQLSQPLYHLTIDHTCNNHKLLYHWMMYHTCNYHNYCTIERWITHATINNGCITEWCITHAIITNSCIIERWNTQTGALIEN